jgi:hypothetical protein
MAHIQKNSKELITDFGKSKRLHVGNTAEELRNLIHSLRNPFGSIARSGAAAPTTPGSAGGYVKAEIDTELINAYQMDTDSSGNRLIYTGRSRRHFHIACSISITAGGASIVSAFKIAKNGTTLLDESIIRRKINVASDIGAAAIHADTFMSNGDYIELWLANETNNFTITVDEFYLFAMGMFV